MLDSIIDFFDVFQTSPNESPSLVAPLINFIFITGFTGYCGYKIYDFAYAGQLGSVGMACYLIPSIILTIIVQKYSSLKIRSFVASTAVLSLLFLCLLPVNLHNARPINDKAFQEALSAAK